MHADVLSKEGVRQDDDGGGDAGGDPQVGQELLLVASGGDEHGRRGKKTVGLEKEIAYEAGLCSMIDGIRYR